MEQAGDSPPKNHARCPKDVQDDGFSLLANPESGLNPPERVEALSALTGGCRQRAGRRLAAAHGHLDHVLHLLGEPEVSCLDVLMNLSATADALRGAAELLAVGQAEVCLSRRDHTSAAHALTTLHRRRPVRP